MRSRLGIFFGALAILQISGGHWALLQTSAWVGMIIQYSQRAGLKAGLTQTFDGDHPCSVYKKAPLLQAKVKKGLLSSLEHYYMRDGTLGFSPAGSKFLS